MLKEIILIVLFVFLILIFSIFIIQQIRSNIAKRKMQTLQQNNQSNMKTTGITIPLYNDLVKIFKELIQYTATITEINILIEQKAEVPANIIQNTKLDYVSFDNLLVWKRSFLRQLDLYFIFVRDVFNSVSYLLDINSKQEFIKQLGYVGNFIDIEKEKENNNDKI